MLHLPTKSGSPTQGRRKQNHHVSTRPTWWFRDCAIPAGKDADSLISLRQYIVCPGVNPIAFQSDRRRHLATYARLCQAHSGHFSDNVNSSSSYPLKVQGAWHLHTLRELIRNDDHQFTSTRQVVFRQHWRRFCDWPGTDRVSWKLQSPHGNWSHTIGLTIR